MSGGNGTVTSARQARQQDPTLRALRQRIDALDERLLKALNERARLAMKIGKLKDRREWPVFDSRREAFVLEHVSRMAQGPLSPRAVRHIFQAILCECRRRQRPRRR